MTINQSCNILVDIKEMFWPNLWPNVAMINQVSCCILLHLWHICNVGAKMFFDVMRFTYRWQSVFLPFWCRRCCFPPLSLTLCSKSIWWLTLLSRNRSHVDSVQLGSRLNSSQPLEYQFFQLSQPNHTHTQEPNFLVVRKAEIRNREYL